MNEGLRRTVPGCRRGRLLRGGLWRLLPVSLLLLLSAGALRGLDQVEERLRLAEGGAVYWENVSEPPLWHAGIRPEARLLRGGPHVATLHPGESVCVRVPGGEVLRWRVEGGEAGIEAGISGGSGLVLFADAAPGSDRTAGQVDPQSPDPALVHVRHSGEGGGSVEVALFVSRRLEQRAQAEYRDSIPLKPSGSVVLSSSLSAAGERFWRVERGESVMIMLDGGARFELEMRRRFPGTESASGQAWRAEVSAGSGAAARPVASLEFVAGAESVEVVRDGKMPVLATSLERGYFSIPGDGPQKVVVTFSAGGYARLHRLEEDGFLLPRANAPPDLVAALRDSVNDQSRAGSPWDVGEDEMVAVMNDPRSASIDRVDLVGVRLLRDNTRLEGGVLGADLLAAAASAVPQYPEVLRRSRQLLGAGTSFRPLLPSGGGVGGLRERLYIVRRLSEIGRPRDWVVGASQLREAGLRNLAGGVFTPLPGGGEPLFYALPDRFGMRRLRLAAERGGGAAGRGAREFWVRFDESPPMRVWLLAERDAPLNESTPSTAEAALAATPGGTLGAAFAQTRDPRPVVDVGFVELIAPAGATALRVWAGDGSEGLPVAVDVREGSGFALGEDAFLGHVDRIGGIGPARRLLFDVLAADDPSTVAGRSLDARELANHWEPLRQHVRSHHRRFVHSVPDAAPARRPADWEARADEFLAAGDYYLAEHLCRWVYLNPDLADKSSRRAAWDRLQSIAERHLDQDRALTNLCTAMIEAPDVQTAAALCRELRFSGRHDLALMIASVLPVDRPSLDDQLAAAFHGRWWATFEALLAGKVDRPVAAEFRGRRAWLDGRFSEAVASWREAGAAGDALIRAVEASAGIRRRVAGGEPEAIRDWAEWEAAIPGRRVWREASLSGATAARGSASVRVLESGSDTLWLVASADRPVRMRLASPRRLRIECRPLHRAGSTSPVDGWITVNAAGTARRIPVINNFRADGLAIDGDPRHVPGLLVDDTLGMDAWNAEVEVRPDRFPVLVRVLQDEPEFRVGHLPPLEFETAAAIWRSDCDAAVVPRDSLVRAWSGGPAGRGGGAQGAGIALLVEAAGEPRELPLMPSDGRPGESAAGLLAPVLDGLRGFAPPSERADERELLDRGRDLLWRLAWGAVIDRVTIGEAAEVAVAESAPPELGPVLGRLLVETAWTPLMSPLRGAGIRRIETDGWSPDDPALGRRVACLAPIGPGEQLVACGDSLVISLNAPEPDQVTLVLSPESLPFLPASPIPLRVESSGADPVEGVLVPGGEPLVVRLAIPAGGGHVRVGIGDSAPNHFVRVLATAERNPEALERSIRRDWCVATAAEPLEWRITGPAWVRIDSLDGGTIASRQVIVAAGEESLIIRPDDGREERLCRLHVLVPAPGKRAPAPVFRESPAVAVARPLAAVRPPLVAEPGPVGDGAGEEGGWNASNDATWSFGAGWERRRALEEDEDGALAADEFFQWDAARRSYVEAWGAYSRSRLLARARTAGDPVVGVEQSLQFRPFGSHLTLTVTGDAYLQGSEWSAGVRGSVSGKRELSRRLAHLPSATVFLRGSSLDRYEGDPAEIDQDIFTPYRSDHGRGLSLGERLILTPFQDTSMFAGVGLTTNEDFNVLDPDSVHYRVGGEQRVGAFQLGAELRGYRFLADEDRDESVWRHRLSIEASGEWLVRDGHRLEAVASYTRFFEENDNAFAVFLRWHFDDGRVLRDFRPDERPFAAIRERRLRVQRDRRRGRRRGRTGRRRAIQMGGVRTR